MLRLICQIIAIESESYPNGGNVCLFSATTCMSQVHADGHLRVRNVICIVTYALPLKINTHYRRLVWVANTIVIIEFEDYYRH